MGTSRCATELTKTSVGSRAAGAWRWLHPVSATPTATTAMNADTLVCTVLLQLKSEWGGLTVTFTAFPMASLVTRWFFFLAQCRECPSSAYSAEQRNCKSRSLHSQTPRLT